MSNFSSHYAGREQSYIKHRFLQRYLQLAAYKTLQGRSPTFNFVDAFAGPWRVNDENYSDASFNQALRILEAVRTDLAQRNSSGPKIRFCFCERDKNSCSKLREYAKSRDGYDIHILEGEFEDRLSEIADICNEGFTFTFIDPTGWDIRSDAILRFLKCQGGEFLINFMAEHVNRHATYPQVAASFGRFLADEDWANDFDDLPEDWSNEERILCLFKQKIKAADAAKYIPDFPILKPRKKGIKMRLLLGTHSKSGLELFRDVQEKVEREEIALRSELHNIEQRKVCLFSEDEIVALQQDNAGVGCPRFRCEARCIIINRLAKVGSLSFSEISTDLLERVPIRKTQIKKLMKQMKIDGNVYYSLSPRRQVPQESTMVSLASNSSPISDVP